MAIPSYDDYVKNPDSFKSDAEIPSYDDYISQQPKPSAVRRYIGDPAVSALKGAVGLDEGIVGLADLATGGRAGKLVKDSGIDFQRAQQGLDELYSPEQKLANENVQQANGVLPTIGAIAQNPSVIPHQIIQSAPLMLGGQAIARGAMSLAPKLAPLAAGAIGEGVVTAGSNAEQVRQQSGNELISPMQSALAAGSGLITGAITQGSGQLASKLGVGDVNTMLLGGNQQSATKGLTRRIAESGGLEAGQEFLQSGQEQAATNLALNKPIGEGVGNAAALGAVTGFGMGIPAAIAQPSGPLSRASTSAPVAPVIEPMQPEATVEPPETAATTEPPVSNTVAPVEADPAAVEPSNTVNSVNPSGSKLYGTEEELTQAKQRAAQRTEELKKALQVKDNHAPEDYQFIRDQILHSNNSFEGAIQNLNKRNAERSNTITPASPGTDNQRTEPSAGQTRTEMPGTQSGNEVTQGAIDPALAFAKDTVSGIRQSLSNSGAVGMTAVTAKLRKAAKDIGVYDKSHSPDEMLNAVERKIAESDVKTTGENNGQIAERDQGATNTSIGAANATNLNAGLTEVNGADNGAAIPPTVNADGGANRNSDSSNGRGLPGDVRGGINGTGGISDSALGDNGVIDQNPVLRAGDELPDELTSPVDAAQPPPQEINDEKAIKETPNAGQERLLNDGAPENGASVLNEDNTGTNDTQKATNPTPQAESEQPVTGANPIGTNPTGQEEKTKPVDESAKPYALSTGKNTFTSKAADTLLDNPKKPDVTRDSHDKVEVSKGVFQLIPKVVNSKPIEIDGIKPQEQDELTTIPEQLITPKAKQPNEQVPIPANSDEVVAQPSEATDGQEEVQSKSKEPDDDAEMEHKGYKIYPTTIKGEKYFTVESIENRDRRLSGEKTIGGDNLFKSLDEAKGFVDQDSQRIKSKAEQAKIAQEEEEKKAIEESKVKSVREDTDGYADALTPMQRGKAISVLSSRLRIDGKIDTVKNHIRDLVAQGKLPSTREENKIKDVSRRRYNQMDNREQAEHERKVKEGGKKTVYQVGDYEVSKIAHDYAQHLINQGNNVKEAQQAEATQKTETSEQEVAINENAEIEPVQPEPTTDTSRTPAADVNSKDGQEVLGKETVTKPLVSKPITQIPEKQSEQELKQEDTVAKDSSKSDKKADDTENQELIGKGSSGEVFKIGNEVEKKSTNDEAKVYGLLSGVKGIAKGYEVNGKIRTPYYKNIISVDTIKYDDRKGLAGLISKSVERINHAVSELTNTGYYYNDPLQFGMNEDHSLDLIDFSMATNKDGDRVLNDNLSLLASFYKQFGLTRQAEAVSQVKEVITNQHHHVKYGTNALLGDEFDGVNYKELTDRLEGKKANNAYYATNARYVNIKGIAQTDNINGIKTVLSVNKLSDKDIKGWELVPVHEQANTEVATEPDNSPLSIFTQMEDAKNLPRKEVIAAEKAAQERMDASPMAERLIYIHKNYYSLIQELIDRKDDPVKLTNCKTL